jgi:hypothetical protein
MGRLGTASFSRSMHDPTPHAPDGWDSVRFLRIINQVSEGGCLQSSNLFQSRVKADIDEPYESETPA